MACRSAPASIGLCFFILIMNGAHLVHAQGTYTPTNIQVTPQSVRVDVGQSINVFCSADGVPALTYAWYFESNTQAVSTGQTLNIPSAQPADNGQYTCLATNTKGNASIVVAVSVWYAPILTTNTSPQFVDEGSTLTLKCTIDANPRTYSVTWLKDGSEVDRTNTRVSGGNNNTNPNLTITNIQSVDAGSYRCRVTHFVNTSSSDIVDVQIALPPQNIALNPSDPVINLNESDPLTLTCSADAVPSPTYTWKAGSTIIGNGSSLVITSAGPVDNRVVTCEVTNSRGNITKTTRINVSYTPRVNIPGSAAFGVDEGNSLTIPCIVDANPADSSFEWLRDSNVLDLSDNAKYGGGTRTSRNLTIYSLASSDAGYYSCRSVNSVGNTTSRAVIVTVNYKPENIQLDPNTLTVNEGDAIVITCSARGVPLPTYTWFREEVNIRNGSVFNVTSAKPKDAGRYTCQATNDKGTANVSLIVSVQYKPRVTSLDDLTSEVGEDITIQCSILSSPNITSVTWQMMKESVVKTLNISNSNNKYGGGTVSNPSLTINDLDIDDVGQYQCKGTNAIGSGSGSYVTLILRYKPENIQLDQNTSTVNEGDPIVITCSARGVPLPTYTWFREEVNIRNGSVFNVTSAKPKDAGRYTCQATNDKGTANVSLIVSVQYKPRVAVANQVFQTTAGTEVTLTCHVNANPPATGYEWSFGGVIFDDNGSSLVVTPADSSDFGQYTCTASNKVGTSDPIIITLEQDVTPEESISSAGPRTFLLLIIIPVLFLVIIIIIVIVTCYRRGKLKKNKKDEDDFDSVPATSAPVTHTTTSEPEKPIELNNGFLY